MAKLKGYQLLSKGIGLFGKYYLFNNNHHLIHISNSGYYERYNRFYFKDIQAITAIRTHFHVWITSLAGIGLLVSLLSLFLSRHIVWVIFITICILMNLFFLIINLIKGPSCRTFIHTATGKTKLNAIRRIKKHNRILYKVYDLISSSQPPPPDGMFLKDEGTTSPPPLKSRPPFQSKAPSIFNNFSNAAKTGALLTPICLLITGGLALACYFTDKHLIKSLIYFALLGNIVGSVVVLITTPLQWNFKNLRSSHWMFLVAGTFLVVLSFAAHITELIESIQNEVSFYGRLIYIIIGLVSILLSGAGFLIYFEAMKKKEMPPPLPVNEN